MSITSILPHLPTNRSAFTKIHPDRVLVRDIAWGRAPAESLTPLESGTKFHHALRRFVEDKRSSPKYRAYLPWIATLRQMLCDLGVSGMEVETKLKQRGAIPGGVCDLVVEGGLAHIGAIEVKVITGTPLASPRCATLAQIGAYSRLVADRGSFDDVWAAVAHIELQTGKVRLFLWENSRALATAAIDLFKAA